ncbi:hypothetical protein D7X33_17285 [Butyricicoccus sp. 1XD8-22]|nr:hypothetical protein D7X33_17285 [Butyricicoccus sp. 1XD8-22]
MYARKQREFPSEVLVTRQNVQSPLGQSIFPQHCASTALQKDNAKIQVVSMRSFIEWPIK